LVCFLKLNHISSIPSKIRIIGTGGKIKIKNIKNDFSKKELPLVDK
jgi:hypothetical protein